MFLFDWVLAGGYETGIFRTCFDQKEAAALNAKLLQAKGKPCVLLLTAFCGLCPGQLCFSCPSYRYPLSCFSRVSSARWVASLTLRWLLGAGPRVDRALSCPHTQAPSPRWASTR